MSNKKANSGKSRNELSKKINPRKSTKRVSGERVEQTYSKINKNGRRTD